MPYTLYKPATLWLIFRIYSRNSALKRSKLPAWRCLEAKWPPQTKWLLCVSEGSVKTLMAVEALIILLSTRLGSLWCQDFYLTHSHSRGEAQTVPNGQITQSKESHIYSQFDVTDPSSALNYCVHYCVILCQSLLCSSVMYISEDQFLSKICI